MYTQEIALQHDETAAKVNLRTGQITKLHKRANNMPEGSEVFEPKAKFVKEYYRTWNFLENVLTDREYRIVHFMTRKAKYQTNSLEPLNDDTSKTKLSEVFNIPRNSVPKLFKKLKSLGVYAEVSVEYDGVENTFWVLNPYIGFNGKFINSSLVEIFKPTTIGSVFYSK